MERIAVEGGLVSSLRGEDGTSLLEVLVALLLIAMGTLGVAPMFVSSMDANAAGADISSLNSMATARMESLRGIAFHNLIPGGSLTTNDVGYSDTSNPGVVVRWEIVDGGGPTGTRTIRLIAFGLTQLTEQPRSVALTTLRAR
jgi:type II secretory pathway pseudopilin PulG